jgi:hypothetical protein
LKENRKIQQWLYYYLNISFDYIPQHQILKNQALKLLIGFDSSLIELCSWRIERTKSSSQVYNWDQSIPSSFCLYTISLFLSFSMIFMLPVCDYISSSWWCIVISVDWGLVYISNGGVHIGTKPYTTQTPSINNPWSMCWVLECPNPINAQAAERP